MQASPSIQSVSFDAEGLMPLGSTAKQREWVDPVGAYLLARLTPGRPPLAPTPEEVERRFSAEREGRKGRLLFFEATRVQGIRSLLYVVEMSFLARGVSAVGHTPSYTATLTVPFTSFRIDLNVAYNLELARRAPSTDTQGFAALADPPDYLLAMLRRVADTLVLDEHLLVAPPFFLDG